MYADQNSQLETCRVVPAVRHGLTNSLRLCIYGHVTCFHGASVYYDKLRIHENTSYIMNAAPVVSTLPKCAENLLFVEIQTRLKQSVLIDESRVKSRTEFQTLGPATEKAVVLSRKRGTASSRRVAERRRRRVSAPETVPQVRWCAVVQTPTNCHCELEPETRQRT